jgi:histone-lysine N-methyltransferase MLL3
MCLSCGSFGVNEEGRIIACSQCGQCFHTYCAGITKISRVILEKGWRCLDCTVCEGCGKATDEGRLLLCDDCDISYHIYCLDPPLEHVPEGNWKCKWCIKCNKCGAKTPGNPNCEWKTNYTECELCYSMSTCPLCNKAYKDSEIILKCIQCDRWCHTTCDPSASINEDEADRLANDGFFCNDCKPKPYGKMSNQHVPENASHYSPASCDTGKFMITVFPSSSSAH